MPNKILKPTDDSQHSRIMKCQLWEDMLPSLQKCQPSLKALELAMIPPDTGHLHLLFLIINALSFSLHWLPQLKSHDKTESLLEVFVHCNNSSSLLHWSQFEFSVGMIIDLTSFSLTRPYSPQGSFCSLLYPYPKYHYHVSKNPACVREEKKANEFHFEGNVELF